eukprot:TRINITY_DN27523_c0_g1_i1.p1 TRINITY_DN27523_c0_g1~~TRINITY_DN27523_c0_g1_i1.p1  ORF type:complete len:343 (+),score=158.87 TRINITY_DN27523_c0_g1_i1:53-1081(+)
MMLSRSTGLRRLAAALRAQQGRPQTRHCSGAAEEVPEAPGHKHKTVFDDLEWIATHEAHVNGHRDIYWPVMYLIGGALGMYLVTDMYKRMTARDDKGKAVIDDLVYHKKDRILGEKPQQHISHPTLLLDAYGLLVCMTYREGSKYQQTVKRPGMDVFLERLKDHYEIVLYSLSEIQHMQELHAKLDPTQQIFSNYITRELVKRIDTGEWPFGVIPSFLAPRYKKNLKDLGRSLERVVHLEFEPEHFYDDATQEDNRILIPRYDGNDHDRELLKLLPFLEYLADRSRAPFDVRKAIHFYKGKMNEYGVDNIGVAYTVYQELKKEKQAAKPQPVFSWSTILGSA